MEAILKQAAEIDRKAWIDLLHASPQGMFYADPGYMDLIAPGWVGIELWDREMLCAVMPLNPRRKAGLTYTFQPPFAQYWGIFFRNLPFEHAYKAFSWKRRAIEAILGAMPKDLRLFAHSFAPEFDYGTPLHWHGFAIGVRYTYCLPLQENPEALLMGMDKDTRQLIRKGGPEVREARDAGQLLALARANLDAGKPITGGADLKVLQQLAAYLCDGRGGFILEAWAGDTPTAAGLFVRFGHKTVYLAGMQAPGAKQDGGTVAVLWEAIRRSCGEGRVFDFEGSMIRGVEAFFRGFGGVPQPYLWIRKNGLPLFLRWIKNLR